MKWYFQVIFYSFADEETGSFRMFNFSEKTILKILSIHFIHVYLKVRLESFINTKDTSRLDANTRDKQRFVHQSTVC